MSKLYLICDESESKGFADNEERFEGDFGVFAGYFLTQENYDNLRNQFQKIYETYAKSGQKLHITDLSPEIQEKIRNEVFECLLKERVTCVYEAISVNGFNHEYMAQRDFQKKQKKDSTGKLTFSSNEEKNRLHSELFQAIFGKAMAFYIDTIDNNIEIQVVTDPIDKQLKKEFETKARELINPFETPVTVKAFDKEKNKPTSKTIKLDSEQLNDDISKAKFEIMIEDNALTLIADILANSLSHYLKKSVEINPNIVLNSAEAIQEHPALSLFYGLSSEMNTNFISDQKYKRENK